MLICADSNILVYLANDHSPFHLTTVRAIPKLISRGDSLVVFPQNLIEFWAVATRPLSSNGLGLSVAQAESEIDNARQTFSLLSESPAVYPEWLRLVTTHKVSGKNVHDARIAAQMNVHLIPNILTFNTRDFSRYTNINAVDPNNV